MKERYNVLDTDFFRGIAILMIMVIHTDQMMTGVNRWIDMFSEIGQMGCQIFLCLSGFGLCFSWENMKKTSFKKKAILFYKKRWLKIAIPLYITLICTLLYFALVKMCNIPSIMYQTIEPKGILCLLFLVNGFSVKYHNYLIVGSWYIGTTVILYVMFPFVFETIKNISTYRKKIIFWIVGCAPFLTQIIDYYILGLNKHLINSFWYFSAFNQLPCFLLGIILYFEIRDKEVEKYGRFYCTLGTMIWLMVFGFFFYFRENLVSSAAVVSIVFARAFYWFWIFFHNNIQNGHKYNCVIESINKWICHYGKISYFAFLVHGFWTRDFLYWLGSWVSLDNTYIYIVCVLAVWLCVYVCSDIYRRLCEFILKMIVQKN